MRPQDVIRKKRDGAQLSREEINFFIDGVTRGTIADYQISALLMAIYLNGMDDTEQEILTDAMLHSGNTLDFSDIDKPKADKHSTGGVGDKTSLLIAPMVAACGICVPMISGRGLGHTGGTLDKLESIPGFRAALTLAEAEKQIARIGCAMLSQTEEIVPADRKMYALRDATATVEVIPLIAASIMSKKLAEDLTGLVLDVKRGSGSFLPKLEDELELAKAMIELGSAHGCPVVAFLTAMDRPLGNACGNALEVAEAIDVLKGGGPPDLIEVTFTLGAAMLILGTVATTVEGAHVLMRDAINSGRALRKFEEIVAAQGGEAGVVRDPTRLPQSRHREIFAAKRDGVVMAVEPRAIGYGIIALGGGRRNMEERVDPSVGFVITAKPGIHVTKGQALATIHTRSEADLAVGRSVLESAIVIGDSAEPPLPLVSHRVTARGVEQLA